MKEQTPEMCLEAVKQNRIALEYVNDIMLQLSLKATLDLII